ncbi:hypothetical protein BUALT_Bualt19G0050000 [Buddleja alternifolia]|uniref:Uncharacterized protein n=1 Tax=Buddleja alternifolia TaxID=168488 RepID=A0AAV6W1F7_9LAMI|nr:hypothetical protein BUALT_Bualt19G0050000 [Buddleja alternifolia]
MKRGGWVYGPDKTRSNKDQRRRAWEHRISPPCRYDQYTPLTTTRARTLLHIRDNNLPKLNWPKKMRDTPQRKKSNKYCRFHKDKGHDTEDCFQLKDEIKCLIKEGKLKEFIAKSAGEEGTRKGGDNRGRRRSRSRSCSRERPRDRGD